MQCALWFLDLLLSLQEPKAQLQRNCSGLIGNVLYCCFSEQYPDQQELQQTKSKPEPISWKATCRCRENRDTRKSSALSNIYCFSCSEAQLQIPDTSPIFKWSFYNYIAMPYGNATGFLIATFNDLESHALTTKLLRELHPSSTEELIHDWQSHHYHWQSNSFMTSYLLRNKVLWPK